MDLNKLNVSELKALWLDQLLEIERCQKNIQAIQGRLFELTKPKEPTAEIVSPPQ